MKRFFSMILAIMLLIFPITSSFASSAGAPPQSGEKELAEDIEPQPDSTEEEMMNGTISKEKLQDILSDIKKRIVIADENAKLNYSLGATNGRAYYDLTWEREGEVQIVQYGEDRNIYYYNHYNTDPMPNNWRMKRLPQFTMEESEAIAKDFIRKVLPEEYKNFTLNEEPEVSLDSYSFRFEFVKDKIPVNDIDAQVIVNYITGSVSYFITSYSPDIYFESSESYISQDEAQAAFRKEIGLRKIYTYSLQGNSRVDNVRMAYAMGLDEQFLINAKTGKREWIGHRSNHYYEKVWNEADESIQPLEQAEIDNKSKLKSMEEAKKVAQALGLFKAKDMEMSYANLYERSDAASGYLWSMEFRDEMSSLRVELDALNLELISFYDYDHIGQLQTITSKNIEEAQKVAEEFVRKYFSNYESKLALSAADLESLIGQQSEVVGLIFERYEGGAFLPEDRISINYSPSMGKIVSVDKFWRSIRLPRPTKFADEEIVYKKIFEENGLELAYHLKWNEKEQRNDAKLCYSVSNTEELPLRFAVTTGERILSPVKTEKIEAYSDLDQSKYQEEAGALFQIGIGFVGGELRPNMPMTQREVLKLIALAFNDYGLTGATDKEQERYWRQLELLIGNESVSDLPATREEMVKYLVRALGYQRIAIKSEIFKSELYDFEQVSNDLRGYVAIANSLRMLDVPQSGEFRPKEQLTRDQAIKMLYNFLAFQ